MALTRIVQHLLISMTLFSSSLGQWEPPSSFEMEPITRYEATFKYNVSNAWCEPLKVQWCSKYGYNSVALPNLLHQQKQAEINSSINIFSELLQQSCANDNVLSFICSLYAPPCTQKYQIPIPPCRPLCKRARRSCLRLLTKHDVGWPRSLRCGQFPRRNPYIVCMDFKKGKYRLRGPVKDLDREALLKRFGVKTQS